jgi:hypothetical protein
MPRIGTKRGMMGVMSKRDTAIDIVEQIDVARELVLNFELGLLAGARGVDEFETMRAKCDRILSEASLRVAVLAEEG